MALTPRTGGVSKRGSVSPAAIETYDDESPFNRYLNICLLLVQRKIENANDDPVCTSNQYDAAFEDDRGDARADELISRGAMAMCEDLSDADALT